MVGRTLQRYRIVEEVGHGGMAVVYRGIDESLEREVAVKLLHPHLAARPEHRRRLAREAKAVARLHHPNNLEIYDFSGEDSSDAYIVTELIKGRTLRAYATEHPFDPPELAAACVHALAGALAHAHAQNIIHRDLKPDNVMIREDGAAPVVKLMDFGIAQIIDRDEKMTVTGSLIGSPAHMAPEIIDGKEADERSDVFSMGTILFWLATGHLPFEAPSPGALLKKILENDYPDPRELRPGLSDALAGVIREALAREPEKRIQSARALQDRLAETLNEVGISRPEELLARFLKAPGDTARDLRRTLVDHLMDAGRKAMAQRKTAKALQAYSRIIGMVPGTPEAGAARDAIDRLKSRARWRKRLAVLVGAGAVSALAAVLVARPPPVPEPLPVPAPVAVTEPTPAAAPDVAWVPPSEPTTTASDVTRPILKNPAKSDRSNLPGGKHARAALADELARRADVPPVSTLPPASTSSSPPAPAGPGSLLEVKVEPYAQITIDGEFKAARKVFSTELAFGRHVVELSHQCCEPFRTEVEVQAGRRLAPIVKELVPKPALLRVQLNGPGDTQVTVDDRFHDYASRLGDNPIRVFMTAAPNGELQYARSVVLRFYRSGYKEVVLPVEVQAGESKALPVTMEPAG